jgi:UDP-glucose 4-epimerase
MNDPKRCLVTGGAGFIGSHLVDRLLADGHEVAALDSLIAGRRENLREAEESPNFAFHQADISSIEDIRPLFEGTDWVFHLAALADIVPSIQQPLDYHRSNVDGTAAVLEAARAGGASAFVYAASSSCYGLPEVFPTPEGADIRPMYPYALTKYVGEQYVMHWARVYGMPCVSLRLFNVFGPRSRTSGAYGAVFGVFLAQKLSERPFTVVGDGTQTRDFTFVADVVDAFAAAAGSGLSGEIFNVGSGDTYSVNHLVSLLGGEVEYIPKRPGEPDCTFADTGKIERMLGWRPKVRFEEGVAVMVENIDLWREAPVWDRGSISEATRDWFEYLGPAREDDSD